MDECKIIDMMARAIYESPGSDLLPKEDHAFPLLSWERLDFKIRDHFRVHAIAAWHAAKAVLAEFGESDVEPIVKAEFMVYGVYGGYTQETKEAEWQRMRRIELGTFLRRWRAMFAAAPDQR